MRMLMRAAAVLVLALASPAVAVVTGTSSRAEYTANGGTTVFSFTFKATDNSHVKVYVDGVSQAAGFTVARNANQDSSPGGTVTFTTAPSSGKVVRIERTLPLTQSQVYTPYSAFPAKATENALDRLVMHGQQLDRRLTDEESARASKDEVLESLILDTRNAQAIGGIGDQTSVLAAGSSQTRALTNWMADVRSLTLNSSMMSLGVSALFNQLGCVDYPVATYNIPMNVARSSAAFALVAGTLVSCGANQLRNWDSPQGGLIESARTNVLAAGAWSANANVITTTNAAAAPDGTATATRLNRTAPGGAVGRGIENAVATRYGGQLYAKGETSTTIAMSFADWPGGGFVPVTAYVAQGPGTISYDYDGGIVIVSGLSTTEWTTIATVMNANASRTGLDLNLYPAGTAGGLGSVLVWGEGITTGDPVPASYVAVGTSRAADDVSMTNPIQSDYFCAKGKFTPYGNRAWTAQSATLFSIGTEGANSTATLKALTDGTLSWTVRDAVGGTRTFSTPHAFAAGSAHSVAGCVGASGTPSIWIDGVLASGTASGSGSGVMSPRPTTFWFGSSGASTNYWNGYVYDVRFGNTDTPTALWAANEGGGGTGSERWLWLSDSINCNESALQAVAASRYGAAAGATVTNEGECYGGTEIGSGLMATADTTYAYEAGAWVPKARPTRLADYDALVFSYGRNDGEPASVFGKAYDKLVSQGAKFIGKVVPVEPPPLATADLTTWNAGDPWPAAGGYGDAVQAAVDKWTTRHIDLWSAFKDEVTAGRHTVAELMRDAVHQRDPAGYSVEADLIVTEMLKNTLLTSAVPTIPGPVLNYLWGVPAAGAWALESRGWDTGLGANPALRVSGIAPSAMVSNVVGSRLTFPTAEMSQVWVSFLIDTDDGGVVDVYVDRGTGSEVKVTTPSGVGVGLQEYPRSIFVAGDLASGPHTVEAEVVSGTARVIGVTYLMAN